MSQMDDWWDFLFPFGIASRPYLTAKAFRGQLAKANKYSAVWRLSLIVFPKYKRNYLLPSVWIKALMDQRNSLTETLKMEESLSIHAKQLQPFQTVFCKEVMDILKSMDHEGIDMMIKLARHFIPIKATNDRIEAIAFISAHLYSQFVLDSMKNDGSIQSILLDENYLLHDLVLCLTRIDHMLDFFYKSLHQEYSANICYQQIIDAIDIINPAAKGWDKFQQENVNMVIEKLYLHLFAPVSSPEDLLLVWSAIFSQDPDLTILHMFYACIFLHSAVPIPEGILPMSIMTEQIGRAKSQLQELTVEDQMKNAISDVDNLINLFHTKEDNSMTRTLIATKLVSIIEYLEGSISNEERIPMEVILNAIGDKPAEATIQ